MPIEIAFHVLSTELSVNSVYTMNVISARQIIFESAKFPVCRFLSMKKCVKAINIIFTIQTLIRSVVKPVDRTV